ncbi:MAG: 4'-phosphopantetheinyl transferase superfamily protein [Rikenellaceae bacterium]
MVKRLIIERILPLEELYAEATPQERVIAEGYTSQSRRREWLSWRVHLRRSLSREEFCGVGVGADVQMCYHSSGAPYIKGADIHISVSHTKDRVAVALSDKPCAVDMELLDRNFSRISSRYISPKESQLLGVHLYGEAIAWCAKEAAYKYVALQPLDFIEDISVTAIDFHSQRITIQVKDITIRAEFSVAEEGYCVVTIFEAAI